LEQQDSTKEGDQQMTLTVKSGVIVDDSAKTAVTNACGELGTAAKAPSTETISAQIVAGWRRPI